MLPAQPNGSSPPSPAEETRSATGAATQSMSTSDPIARHLRAVGGTVVRPDGRGQRKPSERLDDPRQDRQGCWPPAGQWRRQGFRWGKTSPSAKYLQRAEMLARAVDIVADVRASAPGADHLIQFGQQLKDLVHRPPQTLAGLRHLEATFFTYWNETSGPPHVNRFWQLITDDGLPYAHGRYRRRTETRPYPHHRRVRGRRRLHRRGTQA